MTLREEVLKNSGLLVEDWYDDDKNEFKVIFTKSAAEKYYECDDSYGIASVTINAKDKKEAEDLLRENWKQIKREIISNWQDDCESYLEGYLDMLNLSDVKIGEKS